MKRPVLLLSAVTALAGCHRMLPFQSVQADAPALVDARSKDGPTMKDYPGSLDRLARREALADLQLGQAGPVAWYRLDEDAKTTGQALDSSGRGLHGSCVRPDSCPQQVPGKIGQAHLFDGIDEAFQVPDNLGFHAPRLSLALWINMNAYDDGAPLSKPFGAAKLNSWQIECRSDGQVSFTTTDGANTTYLWTSKSVPKSTWVHLAATWDGQQKRIYVDGSLAQSINGATIPYDSQPLIIGADRDSGKLGYYFAGAVDDVRIYDRVLSASEFAALANP